MVFLLLLLFYKFIYLFIYFWLCWVFVSVLRLSLVAASGGHSSSRCVGLSLSWPLVAEHRLQTRRLSNRGSRAQLLRGMWDPPRPGLEPVLSALAGRFSTTAPPGNPEEWFCTITSKRWMPHLFKPNSPNLLQQVNSPPQQMAWDRFEASSTSVLNLKPTSYPSLEILLMAEH